jgi:DDE family transposase
LTGLPDGVLAMVIRDLRATERPRLGRRWAMPHRRRVELACTALRTNLTIRELGAVFGISKSQAHRIVADLVSRLAAILRPVPRDRRWSWVIDGTLVPTRDHSAAAKSKNYRWSCNIQVLVRRKDLRIVGLSRSGPGNRNDPLHYRGSPLENMCVRHGRVLADGAYRAVPELVTPRFEGNRILRDAEWRRHRRRRARVEHAIARLKDWRVLRDHRRRGIRLDETTAAVAALHNLNVELAELRDNS